MSPDQDDADQLPDGFAGVVRLFPLPNLVVFPHVVQALHVFEPRYRELLEDALSGDQLIAMALLQPGWESEYEGRPAIYPMTCIGKVAAHSRLEDGRSNILLRGLRRAMVIREYPPEQSFRLAEVAILDDLYPAGGVARRSQIQRELLVMFQRLVPDAPAAQEQFHQLLGQQVPLGAITDVVTHLLPFEVDFKRQMLAETNVDQRGEQLLARMQTLAEQPLADRGNRKFPPDFSVN